MESSITIARIISLLYLSLGIGLILNKEYYQKEIPNLINNSAYILLAGIFIITTGIIIITLQPNFNNDWTAIITLIGWIATIKGCYLLILPNTIKKFKPLLKNISSYAILVILFGAIFGYFGFIAN